MANRPPASSGTRASASRTPPSTCARTIAFVAAWARVGPSASRAGEGSRGRVEAVVGQHPVDDVPALERGGVVERAGHDQLAGARGPGPLGQPLRAAHGRREADDGLHQAEARRLAPPAAGRRPARARRPRSGTGRGRRRRSGSGSSSTVWIIASSSVHSSPAACGREAVEEVHVDAAADHAPLGAHEQAARRVGRDVGDRRLQGGDHRGVEEVQRRRVEGQHRERAVALEAHRPAHHARSAAPAAAISSASPGPGHPRQPQRVVAVARDHVDVEVEDRLPRGASRRSSGGSRRRRRERPWRARRGAWPRRRRPTGPPRRSRAGRPRARAGRRARARGWPG